MNKIIFEYIWAKNKSKIVYLCSSCGADFPKWHGQCPACNEWGTLSEFKVSNTSSSSINTEKKETHTLESILHKEEVKRISIGIEEVDRVLGGGVLSGSMIYILHPDYYLNKKQCRYL